MNDLREIIKTRRSIRKFQTDEISDADIREMIEAGMHAPSGCNSQCWQFVAVKDKVLMNEIANAAEDGVREFYRAADFDPEYLAARARHTTFFKNAPLVIFVFMTHLEYYDERVTDFYKQAGFTYEEMMRALGSPDILSIGAAVQNILLTIHNKGLGACWMNDPTVSRANISRVLGVPADWRLMSVIPVGKPAYIPRQKQMRDIEDVLEIR